MTTDLVLFRLSMTLSGSWRWALTSAGGVSASHWFRLISWYRSALKISRNFSVVLPMFST